MVAPISTSFPYTSAGSPSTAASSQSPPFREGHREFTHSFEPPAMTSRMQVSTSGVYSDQQIS